MPWRNASASPSGRSITASRTRKRCSPRSSTGSSNDCGRAASVRLIEGADLTAVLEHLAALILHCRAVAARNRAAPVDCRRIGTLSRARRGARARRCDQRSDHADRRHSRARGEGGPDHARRHGIRRRPLPADGDRPAPAPRDGPGPADEQARDRAVAAQGDGPVPERLPGRASPSAEVVYLPRLARTLGRWSRSARSLAARPSALVPQASTRDGEA